jgi:hypothetical protein
MWNVSISVLSKRDRLAAAAHVRYRSGTVAGPENRGRD